MFEIPEVGKSSSASNTTTESSFKDKVKTFINTIMDCVPSEAEDTPRFLVPSSGLTPEDTIAVVQGKYDGDRVAAYGITHYKYADCKPEDLVNVGGHKVHKKCAEAFSKMQQDAAKAGCNIYIVSGYRSSSYQVAVFKKKFNDKNYPTESEMKSRMRFSAPSGFSEHHTGFAIDINSTSQNFANTKEYRWLKEHAAEYGFEMSFPKDGHQGLGFEPWHWRYVGSVESRKIFNQARKDALACNE